MLKIGQKVQIRNNCMFYDKGDITKSSYRGTITVITEYYQDDDLPGEFYITDLMPHPFDRTVLLPLDDQPCDTEFLEEFKNIIKDNVTCTG